MITHLRGYHPAFLFSNQHPRRIVTVLAPAKGANRVSQKICSLQQSISLIGQVPQPALLLVVLRFNQKTTRRNKDEDDQSAGYLSVI
jgi:hypothetical protein